MDRLSCLHMRYLVLGDVHGNAPALEAVLRDAKRRGFDATIFMGDLVGYYPYVVEVVESIRSLQPAHALLGNHDALLLSLIDGQDLLDVREDSLALGVIQRHLAQLSDDDIAFLRGFTERAEGEGWQAAHGGFRHRFEYLSSLASAEANLPQMAQSIGLVAHTHVPKAFACISAAEQSMWRTVEFAAPQTVYRIPPQARAILNPGAVGQPRDGDRQAAYAIFDPAARSFEVRRVPYDVAAVQRRVVEAGYPTSLADRLGQGR